MRPHAFQIIEGVQHYLLTSVMIEVDGPYVQSQVGVAAMLLGQAMGELDDIVEALTGECARSDALLTEAATAPGGDTALASEIAAAVSRPPGLRIRPLIEAAEARRALLGRVLAQSETDTALAPLRARIIDELRQVAAREQRTGIFAR